MEDLTSAAEMTPERCKALVDGILKSMHDGLARDGEELKMLPSYVSKLTAAHGTFYALDLVGADPVLSGRCGDIEKKEWHELRLMAWTNCEISNYSREVRIFEFCGLN